MDIALVHLAMHDAVQAFERKYAPYHFTDPDGLAAGSPAAAVAAAAHRVLVLLYPGQAAGPGGLDEFYTNYLAANGLTGNPGLAVGEAAGAALHAAHYRELIPTPTYRGVEGVIGQWYNPAPLPPMAFLELAFQEPFALNRVDQFRPEPPPPLTSVTYQRDYDEVMAQGPASYTDGHGSFFWSVNFIAQWNETMRQLAAAHLPNLGDSARAFALANMAAADAAMAVWDSKLFYNIWRPDAAIAAGDNDGNKRTAGAPGWAPRFANPPYPDYVSGANGLTGAFTGMLRDIFGTDDMDFSVKTTSAQIPVAERERFYTTFSQAAQEVVDARILLGIHFRFADSEGRRLGERVAHWTFQKFLRPAPGNK
jgi:hypothetical protein